MPEAPKGKWELIMGGNCNDDPNGPISPLNSRQQAVHSCVIYNPDNDKWKILYFQAYEVEQGATFVRSRIYDPDPTSPNPISYQDIPDWPSQLPPPPDGDWKGRLFCSGHVFLDDGRFLVAGGHRKPVDPPNLWARGMPFTYYFNPSDETWYVAGGLINPHGMADGRWYPTLVKMGAPFANRKKVLAFSGYRYEYRPGFDPPQLWFNETVEIYNPDSGWTTLPLEANMPNDVFYHYDPNPEYNWAVTYPRTHLIPYNNEAIKEGEIFFSSPQWQSYRFNADGQGSPKPYWNTVGNPAGVSRGGGCSVLLPIKGTPAPGEDMKVLILGGAADQFTMPTDTVQIINLGGLPTESPWGSMAKLYIPRRNANAVLLPDGKVFVVGGHQFGREENAVTVPELYDPKANNNQGSSTILPAMTYQRTYHSTAILLPDARVLVSGGEMPCYINNNNFEIFTPGYLDPTEGTRPVIDSVNPRTVNYGQLIQIALAASDPPANIASVILMKPGAPTHAFDQDQKGILLNFSQNGTNITATAPLNGNIAPPGYYMLFVLRNKSESTSGQSMIPSVSVYIRLTY